MKEKRLELGFTQKQVADRSDISDRYYGQIERGECSPSIDVTDKIAKSLETSLNWIINDRAEVMENRVNEEIERLKIVFSDISEKQMKTIDGLITQVARLRVLLDDNWKDIAENGEYEMFSQSAHQKPYERKRPIVETYDNRDKTYKDIMKQLYELVPAEDKNIKRKNSKARNMLLGN